MRRSDSFALFDRGEVSPLNKKKIYPQWFLILPLALYIIFFLLPSIMGVAYSFTDWNSRSVLNGVHFVELDNFKEIFTSNKDYLSGIKIYHYFQYCEADPGTSDCHHASGRTEGKRTLQNLTVSAVHSSICYYRSCF